MQVWQIITIVVGVLLSLSGVFGIFYANARNKLAKTTTENYEKTILSYKDIVESQALKITTLAEEMKELRVMHTENVQNIGQLQGELNTWKQLPIRELAEHMSYVSEVQYIMAKHMGIDHLPKLNVKKPNQTSV